MSEITSITVVVPVTNLTDEIATLRAKLAAAEARAERLADLLGDIGDRAHDASSGPAVPDALWEIRGMAYEGVRADGAALAEGDGR